MKVTKSYIKQLVKEELSKVLKEGYGILDPEGALENFGMRTRVAIQDAFMERGFKGGRLRAVKSGANEFAIIIEFGVPGIPDEALVYFNVQQNKFYIAPPANTPHDDINQKIDKIKSEVEYAIEIDNRLINRGSGLPRKPLR